MSNVNTLLTQRLKKGPQSSKMAAMAKQSVNGHLTSFAGVFSVSELSVHEKSNLEELLKAYSQDHGDLDKDLTALISITSEVKAINNQAAILHGERIKKAHAILTRYHDGAFTAWLTTAYGNRQTPYNFLQYYEFHETLPKALHTQVEAMPRQAIYTLASRTGSFEKKRRIIENYKGETKAELLALIRETFPIGGEDKRGQDFGEAAIQNLQKIRTMLNSRRATLTKTQKHANSKLLDELNQMVQECKSR
jgi:hypothetical protein